MKLKGFETRWKCRPRQTKLILFIGTVKSLIQTS